MPEFEGKMLMPGGPVTADPEEISVSAHHFADLLSEASEVTVQTRYGTDLRFSLAGRPGMVDDGLFSKAGAWGNLPAGEAFAVPVEGSGQGRLVIPAGWFPALNEDMMIQIVDGLAVNLEGGGKVGEVFRRALNFASSEPVYLARRNLAEIGIGCNPNAHRADNVLEAEKIKGTLHIAIGDNLHMGGQVEADFHEDFVQPEPNLLLDGQLVIEAGEWRLG
jgi:leucyl aminopeptidase (aminopeptidase T)